MAVPILDLSRIHQPLHEQFCAAFADILHTNQYVLGPRTEQFEKNLAQACGVKHALGVSSGTDALLLALMALEIGPGDEVITTPFTFFATAGCIARVGAKPVFVDIDPMTMNLDPLRVERAITPQTKAIMPVHIFGHPADMNEFKRIAQEHKLALIEDAAQSIGARICCKQTGTLSDIGCLSFYPTKNLSAGGDAGAVLTHNDELATRLRSLRMHGESSRYHHDFVGGNFRIDAFQSAMLDIKLPHLPAWTQARRDNAERYGKLLGNVALRLPVEMPGYTHVYHQYTIRVPAEKREGLKQHLQQRGIGFGVFYPVPLHLQKCFAYLNQPAGSLPIAEQTANEVLSLPIFPGLTMAEQEEVAAALQAFLG